MRICLFLGCFEGTFMIGCKTITIVGGGNIGTQFACVCASKGYKVNMYSSKPHLFDGDLSIVDSEGNVTQTGRINMATHDLEEAVKDSDVIFIIHPAYMFEDDAEMLLPLIKPGVYIGAIPGTGGAEFAFKKCIEKGAKLFGIQRVPAVARLVEYGKSVCVEGKRDKLFVGTIPAGCGSDVAEFLSFVFDMPCDALENYMSVTMTPSNPILHTTRLATMFEDYKAGKVYPRNPLFYGEWTIASSERLLKCDEEHQNILRKLDKMDFSAVKSLVEHYDNSDTPQKLTNKMRSIKSLHNLASPMVEVDGGWIPDFSSRYFTADFPFGLAIIEEFGDIVGVDIPNIKFTMNWYREVSGDRSRLDLSDYGISTVSDIYNLYS